VGLVSGSVPLVNFNANVITDAQAKMLAYKIYPLRQGFKVTWRPEDIEDITQYLTTAGAALPTSSTFNDPYMIAIVYGAAGGQSTLHVEAVANFEGQYTSQTFMPGGLETTGKPAEAGWYEKVKNALSGVDQITDAISSAGRSAQGVAALGTLANGLYSAGRLSRTNLPRLGYR
jgi:hypothetical protein